MAITTPAELEEHYRAYISTLNAENWSHLATILASPVVHNGKTLDAAGYRNLVFPDTTFTIVELVADVEKRLVASRLDITFGDRRVKEHVWYEFDQDWRIKEVWSMVQDA